MSRNDVTLNVTALIAVIKNSCDATSTDGGTQTRGWVGFQGKDSPEHGTPEATKSITRSLRRSHEPAALLS
jgi:hypothetical protein